MVGGINAPKKISCIGTDGITRPQLLKGKDDLRQDAVMQQVFGLMNNLLATAAPAATAGAKTANNKLSIRTFKVVPLSQRSGILEWCVNTEPISDFLIGTDKNSGAHKKYNPKGVKFINTYSYLVFCCYNFPSVNYFFSKLENLVLKSMKVLRQSRCFLKTLCFPAK